MRCGIEKIVQDDRIVALAVSKEVRIRHDANCTGWRG
jgi:hypothetical protein